MSRFIRWRCRLEVIVHGAISELGALIDPAAVIELSLLIFRKVPGHTSGVDPARSDMESTRSRSPEQNPPLDRGEIVALDYGDSLQARISPFR